MTETLTALGRISLAGTVWTLLLAAVLSLLAAPSPVWPLAGLLAPDMLLAMAVAVAATIAMAIADRGKAVAALGVVAGAALFAYSPLAGPAWLSSLGFGIVLALPIAVLVGKGGRIEVIFAALATGVAALTLTTGALQGPGGDLPLRLAVMGALMTAALAASLLFGSPARRRAVPREREMR